MAPGFIDTHVHIVALPFAQKLMQAAEDRILYRLERIRGLAQGITNPATFDVMGMAKQALRTAMPIP